MIFPRMAVIGCGLIGSSVIRAARAAGAVATVAVCDASPAHRAEIESLGYADLVTADPAEAVRDADLVVFAVPVLAMGATAAAAAGAMKPGAVVTDVGSVKVSVAEALRGALPQTIHLVPGHPIAGTEQSGPASGFAELFRGRWVILTPEAEGSPDYQDAVRRLTDFWTALGAQVDAMDAAHHDLVLAVTSHLPHLIAYNIVGTAADLEGVAEAEVMKYSAGGFRDFTRIAAGEPKMWRDIMLANRDELLAQSKLFQQALAQLEQAISSGNAQALEDMLTLASETRAHWRMGAQRTSKQP